MPKIHSNQSISCLINGREKAGIKTLTALKHSLIIHKLFMMCMEI